MIYRWIVSLSFIFMYVWEVVVSFAFNCILLVKWLVFCSSSAIRIGCFYISRHLFMSILMAWCNTTIVEPLVVTGHNFKFSQWKDYIWNLVSDRDHFWVVTTLSFSTVINLHWATTWRRVWLVWSVWSVVLLRVYGELWTCSLRGLFCFSCKRLFTFWNEIYEKFARPV